jgi:hypothetical protein
MRLDIPTVVIMAFFVVTGLAPYGLSVDLTYPVVHLSLDLSLQYIGLLVALGLLLGWRWTHIDRSARFVGRLSTWALLGIVMVQFCSTLAGMTSGTGTLHFIVLWPALSGNSPVAFLVVGAVAAGYLYWQSLALGDVPATMRTTVPHTVV